MLFLSYFISVFLSKFSLISRKIQSDMKMKHSVKIRTLKCIKYRYFAYCNEHIIDSFNYALKKVYISIWFVKKKKEKYMYTACELKIDKKLDKLVMFCSY